MALLGFQEEATCLVLELSSSEGLDRRSWALGAFERRGKKGTSS